MAQDQNKFTPEQDTLQCAVADLIELKNQFEEDSCEYAKMEGVIDKIKSVIFKL